MFWWLLAFMAQSIALCYVIYRLRNNTIFEQEETLVFHESVISSSEIEFHHQEEDQELDQDSDNSGFSSNTEFELSSYLGSSEGYKSDLSDYPSQSD